MSKRKIFLLVSLATGLVLIGITPAVLQFVGEQGLIGAREHGVRINAEGIKGFILGIEADSLEGWLPVSSTRGPSLPVQVKVEQLSARIKIPLLPPGLPVTELRAKMYGGDISATTSLLARFKRLSLEASNIDLSLHPQLRALGIEDGKLTIKFKDHPGDLKWTARTPYHIELESLRFSPPSQIRSFIALNEISDGSLRADISAAPSGEISIDSAEFDSSLAAGKFTGVARIAANGELVISQALLKVELNRPDSAKLATWLPLITNRRVSPEAQSFSCSFRSTSCKDPHDLEIGRSCLAATCN
jgi:hypothetical protein